MPKHRTQFRRQRPIKGGRDPLPSCVLHSIRQAITGLALQHSCSRSFVIATILADALRMPLSGKDRYDGRTP